MSKMQTVKIPLEDIVVYASQDILEMDKTVKVRRSKILSNCSHVSVTFNPI